MNMFPKTGETWAPTLPWPTDECPAGFYTHGLSLALVGGKAGAAWAIQGRTDLHFVREPLAEEAAVAQAWEWRYGDAAFPEPSHSCLLGDMDKPRPVPTEGSVREMGRYGSGPVVIDAVGASVVYGHRPDGTPVTIYLRDMRLGWQRIEG
jgi:hypothetical protein